VPSLSDSFIFLTLTWLVVVLKFINFRFALFTPPLGDFHSSYPSAPRTPPVSPLRFPNLSPTLPPWTRPRPRISWPPLHALNPFRARTSLTHSPCSFAPSAEHSRSLYLTLRTSPGSFAACHGSAAVLRSLSSPPPCLLPQ
jgi:hypothetical protein